jgi:hypothetical protein
MMTLTTRIAIIEPTPVREVFDECRRLIGGEQAQYRHLETSEFGPPGVSQYRNDASQGLPALLWIYYGADAPLMPDDETGYAEEDRSSWPSKDGWSIEVCFDTAYGYRADNGAGCSDLHASLVQQLGQWLTERGLTWLWFHEYTGEWHPSTDPITILGDPERGRLPNIAVAV